MLRNIKTGEKFESDGKIWQFMEQFSDGRLHLEHIADGAPWILSESDFVELLSDGALQKSLNGASARLRNRLVSDLPKVKRKEADRRWHYVANCLARGLRASESKIEPNYPRKSA